MPREPKRKILPIPDIPARGLTTYDAKDPDTAYPPIVPWLSRPATTRCAWSSRMTAVVGKGGTATLYIDGVAVGDGRIEQTEAFLFSADETCDVGNEFGSPVTADYGRRKFSGEVECVELELGLDDHNHLIKPEDRVTLAMGSQ